MPSSMSQFRLHPWVLQPLIFTFAVWMLNYNLIAVQQHTPDIFMGLWQQTNRSLDEFIPPLPSNQTQLFQLGQLFGRLSYNSTDPQTILQIATILHIPIESLNTQKLDLIKDRMIEVTLQGSLLSRILGLFSFVNLLWFFSLCGIVILFYPCVHILFGSIIESFSALVINLLIAVRPIMEPSGYVLSYLLVVQGFRYLPEVGLFISLTGSLLFGALMFDSDRKHRDVPARYNPHLQKIKQQFFYLFLTLSLIPPAILYQSKLFGFLAVASFFGFLGFSIICEGLCWLIGYEDEDAMHRTSAVSLMLMTVFILMRIRVIDVQNKQWFEPFSTGILTFGMIAYFLAQLILSSRYYYSRSAPNRYLHNQLVMVVSLFSALLIGSIFQLAPLYNVGLTFAVLYAMEKMYEIDLDRWLIPALFFTCVIIYFISMYLRTHPDFIVDLFDSSLTKESYLLA